MLAGMDEAGPHLSMLAVRAMEARLGFKLPQDYANFMLAYNGGRPVPNGFPIQGLENNPVGALQVFFGVGLSAESCDVEWNYALFAEDGIKKFLPIACTGCGDIICLVVAGESKGAVVLWDAHVEAETPVADRIYPVAEDFTAFLQTLAELP